MNNYIKSNIKYLNQHNKIADILNINEQSLKNKIYDEKRSFSVDDLIKISKSLNISLDDLVYKDLSKENN